MTNMEAQNPDLKTVARRVGTRQVSGEATGQGRSEWTEGGFFLIHGDRPTRGIEVTGRLHPFGGEPGADIHPRVYSFTDGLTPDDVHDLTGDTPTIWAGHRDSPGCSRGTFRGGGWTWPGGGHRTDMTRMGSP